LIFTSLRLPVESEVAVLMGGDVAAGSRVAVVSCRRRYAFLPYGGKKAIVVVQWRVCAHTDRWQNSIRLLVMHFTQNPRYPTTCLTVSLVLSSQDIEG